MLWFALALFGAGACQSVLGIEEGRPLEGAGGSVSSSSSAGGQAVGVGGAGGVAGATTVSSTAATGGVGGAGGAGGFDGVVPPDWTTSFGAVYLFDNDLEQDVVDGRALTSVGTPSAAATFMQGTGAVNLSISDAFSYSGDGPFTGNAMTFGGWCWVAPDNVTVLQRKGGMTDPAFGYSLTREAESAVCVISDGSAETRVTGGSWPTAMWTHVVCTVSFAGDVTTYVNGDQVAQGMGNLTHPMAAELSVGAGTFTGSSTSCSFWMPSSPPMRWRVFMPATSPGMHASAALRTLLPTSNVAPIA